MLEGFEILTKPLDEWEKNRLIPCIVRSFLLNHVGKEKFISIQDIAAGLFKLGFKTKKGKKLPSTDVRKYIHYIRENRLVPRLVANGRGYWVEPDPRKVERYVKKSLYPRANAISRVGEALMKDVKEPFELMKMKCLRTEGKIKFEFSRSTEPPDEKKYTIEAIGKRCSDLQEKMKAMFNLEEVQSN